MNNVIVTGGCGFIGSNFIYHCLNKSNYRILNVDDLTYSANPSNLDAISKSSRYNFIKGNICDFDLMNDIYDNFKPNILVNFAAETHVDRSIDSPDNFIKTNILGTLNILKVSSDYFKENNNFRYIHVSTDEVYGSLSIGSKLFTEESSYKPNSPYSASKASSDHLVRAWNKTYGLPTIVSNCSNNYGPFQFPEKLIPLIIANCIDENPLPIYGNGENIRDWLFVEDHCSALKLIMEKGKSGSQYLIGGNNEISNINIVKKICSIIDILKPRKNHESYKELITFVEDRPGHDFRYAIDSSKIHKDLKWESSKSFNQGLEQTIKWYIDNELWWRKIQKNKYNQERLGLNK